MVGHKLGEFATTRKRFSYRYVYGLGGKAETTNPQSYEKQVILSIPCPLLDCFLNASY